MPCMGCSTEKHAHWNQEVTVWRFGHDAMANPNRGTTFEPSSCSVKGSGPRDEGESFCRVKWKEKRFFLSVFQEWEPVEKVRTGKDFHTGMPCCLVFCWCGICFGDEGGDVMRFIPCFEHVSIGVQTSPETMPWYQHHWAGLAFGAWIRKCLAPWWPLFKCTKKWWHCWSRVGRIPTTNTLVSMFDFWGGGAYGFIMTFRFGPYFFPPFGGPVVLGGGADQLVVIVGLMARCFGILRVRNNEPLAEVKRSCWKIASLKSWPDFTPENRQLLHPFTGKKEETIIFQLSILQVRSPVSFREGEPGRSTSPNSFSPSSGEIFRMDPKKVTTKRFGGFLVVCHKRKNALPGGSFGWNASWKHHAAWRFRFLLR